MLDEITYREMFQNFPISYIGLVHSVLDNALSKRDLVALMSFFFPDQPFNLET